MSAIDPQALRRAFGAFMTGVTVVTSRDKDGQPLGFTANSFTSVSLDPPLVLVCLANTSTNWRAFTEGSGFAVNVLSESQKDISNIFARPSDNRFEHVAWHKGPHGAPVLEGVSAWFDCSMHKVVPAGDHAIMIVEVRAFDTGPAPGLGYVRGAYVTPATEAKALDRRTGIMVSALIKQGNSVLLVDHRDGSLTLPEAQVGDDGVTATLNRLLERTGLTTEAGFIYAVYEDTHRGCQHITFLCEAEEGMPRTGAFVPPTNSSLMDLADPAMVAMLARFAEEMQLGSFGVYCGNERSGQVREINMGAL